MNTAVLNKSLVSSDLEAHVAGICVCDTHEHLPAEEKWTSRLSGGLNPVPIADVLSDLFVSGYILAELRTAGASQEALICVQQADKFDIKTRWAGIAEAWQAVRWTGPGEAVRLLAEKLYEMDEISPEALAAAQPRLLELCKPGMRLAILRDWANLDHVQIDSQIDSFSRLCHPDISGPEFFLYDLSWWAFSRGEVDVAGLAAETGITVSTLSRLQEVFEVLASKYGGCAIAFKSQHAYNRTLRWQERSDDETARALTVLLMSSPTETHDAARLCLGDWCLARGVELTQRLGIPFKIHTGLLGGNSRIADFEQFRPSHLCGLLKRYPDARFVLMHTGYPYVEETIAVAKHFPNVWVDLCWAWTVNPRTTMEFMRRFIHGVPISKIFAFGGDTNTPTTSFAYSLQMRKWLTRSLQAEVSDGEMTERDAIDVATRILRENQLSFFDLAGKRNSIRKQLRSREVKSAGGVG